MTFDTLPSLLADVSRQAARLGALSPDPPLIRARLADAYRDLSTTPPSTRAFHSATVSMTEAAWHSLALVTELLRHETVLAAAGEHVSEDAAEHLRHTVLRAAVDTADLQLSHIARRPAHAERWTRRVLAILGVTLDDETPDVAEVRLEALEAALQHEG